MWNNLVTQIRWKSWVEILGRKIVWKTNKLGGKISWKSLKDRFFGKLCVKNGWKNEWKRSVE